MKIKTSPCYVFCSTGVVVLTLNKRRMLLCYFFFSEGPKISFCSWGQTIRRSLPTPVNHRLHLTFVQVWFSVHWQLFVGKGKKKTKPIKTSFKGGIKNTMVPFIHSVHFKHKCSSVYSVHEFLLSLSEINWKLLWNNEYTYHIGVILWNRSEYSRFCSCN